MALAITVYLMIASVFIVVFVILATEVGVKICSYVFATAVIVVVWINLAVYFIKVAP